MAGVMEAKVKPRTMIPIFQLMSAEGRPVSIWDYKGRKNLVIVFLTRDEWQLCLEFLRSTINVYHQYEEEDAVVLAIVRGNLADATAIQHDLKPPFPILYDPDGRVTQRFASHPPAVFVADRYGEVHAEWAVVPEKGFPTQKEVLDALDLINLECPE